MRILLIEDDNDIAGRLRAGLEALGYAVEHAVDGADGYLMGKDENYDAAILDLGLPKMQGLDVLRRWRAEGSSLPVLVLTARGMWSEKVEGLNAEPVEVTARELRMLNYFMHRIGRIISQAELTEHLYALDDSRESNTIEVYVSRLRRKLGADIITTVRGLGYKMDEHR